MKWHEVKLGYDFLLDCVYADKGTMFFEYHRLSVGDQLKIKHDKAWVDAVLRRDLGGWYLETNDYKTRNVNDRCAKINIRRQTP